MKLQKSHRILAVGMALLLCISTAGLGVAAASEDAQADAKPADSSAESIKDSLGINRKPMKFHFEKAAESDRLTLDVDKKEGVLRLTDKKTGSVWQSSVEEYPMDKTASGLIRSNMGSQLVVKYVDSFGNVSAVSSRTDCVQNGSISLSHIKNGIRITYKFSKAGVTVPVEFTLDGDCFQASIKTDEVKETSEKYRVYTMELLPYFGTAGLKDKGYMLVPDGSGALIRFNNGKARLSDYSQEIYGRDSAIAIKAQGPVTKTARLPVFGVQKNEKAFLAVISEGESRAKVNASVSGVQSQYNTVYTEFVYRYFDSVAVKEKNWDSKSFKVFEKIPAAKESFTVRYYPLDADKSDYAGMAQRYRKVLMDEQKLTSTIKNEVQPLYVDFFGSVKKTCYFWGIPYTATIPLTSYEQAAEIMQTLKDKGVSNVVAHYDTWSSNSTDRNIPTGLKTCRALGGKRGFRSLMDSVNKNQYSLYCSINLTEMTKNRWGYNRKWDSAKGVSQSPAMQNAFLLSTYEKDPDAPTVFFLRPGKVLTAAKDAAAQMKKLGATGLAPLTLGQQMYSDFGKNKVDRMESVNMWQEALLDLRNAGQGLLLSEPNAYAFAAVTDITDVPTDSSHFYVEDEAVPFYSLALHGLRSMSISSVNYQDDPQNALLKAMELGIGLKFTWTAANESKLSETPYDYLYNGNYKDWLEDAVSMQAVVEKELKNLNGQAIVRHDVLQKDVVRTTYENGTRIYVNYSAEAVKADGQTIPAKGYLVV